MSLLRFPRPSVLLRPFFVTSVTWPLVALLYSLHLSSLLLFETREAIQVVLYIVLPVLGVSLVSQGFYSLGAQKRGRSVLMEGPSLTLIEARVNQCLRVWIALAVFETIVSGGVPLLWSLIGIAKSNFDYGISSVHGMVNALLLALAVTSFALYLYTGRRRHLRLPLIAIVWSLVLVSRGTLFVLLMECAIVYLRLRRVKFSSLLRLMALGCAALLAFGYIGDFRSGAQAFRHLAQPTPNFPDWAPSGLLWAYIYITTPINNLLYTMHTIHPLYNPMLPNTAATLFPTVVRTIVYGKQGASTAISGNLVVEALNVSTAYVGPYHDMGRAGLIGFSILSAVFCELYWHKNGFRNILYFSMFSQALILSLFYNLLFSLPILGQLVWFHYFTKARRRPLVTNTTAATGEVSAVPGVRRII